MSERIHGLAQLLPDKTAIKDYRLEELQQLAKRFPYFAPAHFLLLQKLKESGSPAYELQQGKAVLYFHDPLQFDYFISAGKFLMEEGDLYPADEKNIKNGGAAMQTVAGNVPPTDAVDGELFVPATEASSDESGRSLPSLAEVPALVEQRPLQSEPDTVKETEEIIAAQPVVLPVSPLTEIALPTVISKETAKDNLAEDNSHVNDLRTKPEPVAEKRHATANAPGSKPPSAGGKGEGLLFEPFHTVDYFASQGIKISAEGLPKDKLSQQLRSFTEWLKVMKRLPAAGIEAAPHTTAENTVAHLASHSVEGSDVVTEAMAEVWARQGNKAKAIETYNKLSLQNPSKKSYFAAKIENLSGT